jgi:cytoskeletal protein RodZ
MNKMYKLNSNILVYIIVALILCVLFFAYMSSQSQAKTLPNPVPSPVCDNGQRVGNPHCITPTATPKPTDKPIQRIWCHAYFLNCCKDAYFIGEKCPRKWDEGKCPTITPTATPTVEPTIIHTKPTVTPTVTPTETPEATPTATPLPTIEPIKEAVRTVQVGSSAPSNDAPRCEEMTPVKVNDVWYSDYRVENGKASLELHWGLNDAYKNVNIVYGHKPLEWVYGAVAIPNNGSLRIGELEPYTTYWFQVAYIDSCMPGPYSEPIDP